MSSFTDGADRKWTFQVNVLSVKRVKEQTGVDLLTLMNPEGDAFEKLATDIVGLCDVMVAFLADQLQEHDVTPDEFLRAIDNEDIVRNATRACMKAILSFSQTPKAKLMKTAFGKVWTATANRERQQLKHALELVESPEFDRLVDETANSVISGKASSA